MVAPEHSPRRPARLLQIAGVGDDDEAILAGIREYPVSRLVLLHTPEYQERAESLRRTIEALKLDTELVEVQGDVVLSVLRAVSALASEERTKGYEIYANVSAGPRVTGCAVMAAAFVNGLKAFHVKAGRPATLPVLKLSYQEIVSEAKLRILRAIERNGGHVESLKELGQATGMDTSLLSYHLRGGRKAKGLVDLGLAEIQHGARGRLRIGLTPTGAVLLDGYPAPDALGTAP